MRPTDSTYRPDIDGLRALAVIAVIIFHAWPNQLSGGFVGVDVFFVISGFLITNIILNNIERNTFNIVEFYARRIKRIFPSLLLVLSATVILGGFILLPNDYNQLGQHVLGGSLFSSNFLLWYEAGYFDSLAENKPLLHLWSLGIEEQFYLIWPISLLFIWRSKRHRMQVIFAVAIFSFILNVILLEKFPTATFYSPLTRVWELLIGSIFASLFHNNKNFHNTSIAKFFSNRDFVKNLSSLLGLCLILYAMRYYSKEDLFPGWSATIPTLGTLMIISSGASSWVNKLILSNKIAVYIGLISYPLYLWHWPLLSYASIYANEGYAQIPHLKVLAVAVSFITAILTYHYLELSFKDRPLKSTSKSLMISLIVPIIAASVLIGTEGLPRRFPELTNAIENLKEETSIYPQEYREGICFLKQDQSYESFSEVCSPSKASETKIFLWGDSYSAHLYHGLKSMLQNSEELISQYNASACPPLVAYADELRPHCHNINKFVLKKIQKEKPNVLIMSAAWQSYYQKKNFTENLSDTLKLLKARGIRVVLIGSALVIGNAPLRAVIRARGADSIPNSRLPELKIIDNILRKIAQDQKIEFIEPVSSLCDEENCRLSVKKNGVTKLLSWDVGHMTRDGSSLFAQTFLKSVIK